MAAYMICTTQGIPLVCSGKGQLDWKGCAKLVASIAILLTKERYCEFSANNLVYYVVPVAQNSRVYYCTVIDINSSISPKLVKLRAFFFANTVKVQYGEVIQKLVAYYDNKTALELQSSTFSDSLADDREDEDIYQTVFDNNTAKDAIRVLEDYFLMYLIDFPHSQCILQHCFRSLDELNGQMCSVHVLYKEVCVYSTFVSDSTSTVCHGLSSHWVSVAVKHSSAKPNPSVVYHIGSELLLLMNWGDYSLALLMRDDMLLLQPVTPPSSAILRKYEPIGYLTPSLLTAWDHACQSFRRSMPTAGTGAFPTETDLQNLFTETPLIVSSPTSTVSPTIDIDSAQQSSAPSPTSPAIEYVRPVAPTSIKSSHSFHTVAEVNEDTAAPSGPSKPSGPPRPGRSLRASSPLV